MGWTLNPNTAQAGPYPDRLQAIIGHDAHRTARAEITSWPGYAPTPARELGSLAVRLGLDRVWVKDESGRFGLGAVPPRARWGSRSRAASRGWLGCWA